MSCEKPVKSMPTCGYVTDIFFLPGMRLMVWSLNEVLCFNKLALDL